MNPDFTESALPADVPRIENPRLSDKSALTLLVAYLIFRQVTARIGLGALPKLIKGAPWSVPLLNNSMIILIAAGTDLGDRPAMFGLAVFTSVIQSVITGSVLYWAGYRFGPRLAVLAAEENSMWAGLWNPKQVARAHNFLERRGMLAVFFGRVIEWFTTPMLLVCGASRLSPRHFFPPYIAGSIVFGGGFLYVGSRFGARYPWLTEWIEGLGKWTLWITLGLLVLLGLALLVQRVVPEPPADMEETPADAVDDLSDIDNSEDDDTGSWGSAGSDPDENPTHSV